MPKKSEARANYASVSHIRSLTIQNRQLKKTLGTLISWMASSANSPIRQDEAMKLLCMLEGEDL